MAKRKQRRPPPFASSSSSSSSSSAAARTSPTTLPTAVAARRRRVPSTSSSLLLTTTAFLLLSFLPRVDGAAREGAVRGRRTIEIRREVVGAASCDRPTHEQEDDARTSVGTSGARDVLRALAESRGGGRDDVEEDGTRPFQRGRGKMAGKWGIVARRRIIHRGGNVDDDNGRHRLHGAVPPKDEPIISPSLLACDWSDMKGEIKKCLDAGCPWLHVDVFDGVFLDSPNALTFGPQMVGSIRKRFADPVLDVHLCVDRPQRYARPMADAGATRIIFQWEAMGDGNDGGDELDDALGSAIAFAKDITSLGMACGVSINPETDVATIFPLLDTGMLDLVDVLAVEPGFGGQQFNHVAIQKIESLRQYRDQSLSPRGIDLKILVDGGINNSTSSVVTDAGADILVAGTALFRHPQGFEAAVKELR